MTMLRIVCIVEGHGEVEADPLLLRRIGAELVDAVSPKVLRSIRVPASKLVKQNEIERAVELAARELGSRGAIFIVVDCDDNCPAKLGLQLLGRARAARPDQLVGLALAKREYEAWFLASAASLRGRRGLTSDLVPPPDPEEIRDAKGWLSQHMKRSASYSETTDQASLTASFNMRAARSADSFDKCYREVAALLIALPSEGG